MDVTMPQLGETVTEGTITKWLKQVGDQVSVDEPLFEVSTDKVDSEVPSPFAGTLSEIRVPEGETALVGAVLGVIGAQGDSSASTSSTSEAAPEPVPVAPLPPEARPEAPVVVSSPVSQAPAQQTDTSPTAVGASTAVMSPIVRKMISEAGLDSAQIRGTGAGGRITRSDVLAASGAATTTLASSPSPVVAPPAAAADPAAPAASAPGVAAPPSRGTIVIPFDNIRRRTGEHMVRSKATSPHVYTSMEVDFERVERVRKTVGKQWKSEEGFSLTYLPFIARAYCQAVREFPNVNATIDDETLVVNNDVHLGIAIDLNFAGLIAPVIHNADGKRMRLLARDIRSLADRARNKQLNPDEVAGGTFTITNPGPFGTYMTLPIINQPQVAILSTDGVAKRPVVVEGPDGEDTIAIHHTAILALAWDHRAFDGALASAFLRHMKEIIETRDWAAEVS